MVVEAVLAPVSEAIETRVSYLWLRPDGIVVCTIKPGVRLELEDGLEINRIIRGFSEPLIQRPILTDISAPHDTAPGMRRHGASEATRQTTLKLGLLVRTPVSRMLGNAFMAAKRPPFPTKLFTDEESAIAWLREDWSGG